MSWLGPKRLEDASRVLRGLGLILARRAADSDLVRQAAAADTQRAVQYAADLLKSESLAAEARQQHAATAYTEAHKSSSSAYKQDQQHTSSSRSAPTSPSAPASPPPHPVRSEPSTGAFDLPGSKGYIHTAEAPSWSNSLNAAAATLNAAASPAVPFAASIPSAEAGAQASASEAQTPQFPSPLSSSIGDTSLRSPSTDSQPNSSSSSSDSKTQHHEILRSPWASATAGANFEEGPMMAAAAASHHANLTSRSTLADITSSTQPAPPSPSTPSPTISSTDSSAQATAMDSPRSPSPSTSPPTATAATSGAASPATPAAASPSQRKAQARKQLRERRVPESPFGRALGFAGLGAGLVMGSLTDRLGSAWSGRRAKEGESKPLYSPYLTESNAERLANALCRMRGAALKLGQMLSIQDENIMPPQVQAALERVREGADVMPRAQLAQQLQVELGEGWQEAHLDEFDWHPRAAASIGQVHLAKLKDGRTIAMKVQYPGVARSIESDVDNLMRLIMVANILPKGLYVENAVAVAKRELALECDYSWEAASQARFKQLVEADKSLAGKAEQGSWVERTKGTRTAVSRLISPTMAASIKERLPDKQSDCYQHEWVEGEAIDKVCEEPQEVRDEVGSLLLRITLGELFTWRFMQTDPNWGNFLYDANSKMLHLIDFGAAREFPEIFVDNYLLMVAACAANNRDAIISQSIRLGFLTGDESKVMLDAHTEAGLVVGLPFSSTAPTYDFGQHGGMTARISELGAVMLKHRLTPPPEEAYSLHRKLSGAFLACMKLKAKVPCRSLFQQVMNSHNWQGLRGDAERLQILADLKASLNSAAP
ncbi:ABC1 family-domain-containing protein [Dunaliella salina]|uniref:ABC1 family-domain-containing protein n=1 Tax=Dunaliella salina TaxID=3046 RepID=A0ABQ7GUA0_DUNSA|nr:ABC1 family-domain-containing protein [Dunaliella salina]|eukprot:KAF5838123.1 ABC1 family-domain-containing protein [Dunaliella salina]